MKKNNLTTSKQPLGSRIATLYRKPLWSVFMMTLLIFCGILSQQLFPPNTRQFFSQLPLWIPLAIFIFFLILICIGLVVKVYGIDKFVVKDLLASSLHTSFISILFIFVFIFYITPTVSDSFIGAISGDKPWLAFFLAIVFLLLEILIYPLPQVYDPLPMEDRDILVSAISLPMAILNKSSDQPPTIDLYQRQNEGFCYPFQSCPKIKDVWVVYSDDCLNVAKTIFPSSNQPLIDYITEILKAKGHTNVKIHLAQSSVDFNNYDCCFNGLQNLFHDIGKEKASRTIVNISPGTVVVGSALSIFAIQGNRMLAYNSQNPVDAQKVFVAPNNHLLSMEDLINNISVEIHNLRNKTT